MEDDLIRCGRKVHGVTEPSVAGVKSSALIQQQEMEEALIGSIGFFNIEAALKYVDAAQRQALKERAERM